MEFGPEEIYEEDPFDDREEEYDYPTEDEYPEEDYWDRVYDQERIDDYLIPIEMDCN